MFLTTRRLFTAILFLALFVMTTREIADPDFWWHLRTGQYIVETRSIPHVDIFSHTNAGRFWVTHEWLSEVFIYILFALGSFPALILAFATVITAAFALAYARSHGQPYAAAFALLLAAVATAPTWGVRPQMISLLLTSVFLFVLERKRDAAWILVPLMVLWVNLHSGYALGLALIAVYLVGNIVESLFAQNGTRNTQYATRITHHVSRFTPSATLRARFYVLPSPLALAFLLSLLVVPLNPNGATMYVYPFETLTSRAMQAYIQEWFSPDFHLVEWQPFAWLLLGTLAAIALSGKRVSLTHTLLLAVFGYAALRSARNIPIFALIAAPILAEQVWHIIGARWVSSTNGTNTCPCGRCKGKRMTRGVLIVNWLILAMIVAAGSVRVAMVMSNQRAVERARFPAAAVDFLQAQKITTPLYNSYGWGGYLIWRLHPGTRVFIDGRADVYGDAFIEDVYLKAYRGGAGWHEPLEHYGVRVVLIEPNAPLAVRLAQEREWRKVYEDRQAVVFERE